MIHNGPPRPVGMEMPELGQAIFTYANIIIVIIALVLAARYARKRRSPVPFYFLIGGGVAVLLEPIVDVTGLCHFPEVGSWELLTSYGVTLPFYTLPAFIWYVGGQGFLALMALEKGVEFRSLFKLWLIYVAVNVALEVPALQMGTFLYYGDQPFVLFGFPVWWGFCNAMGPILAATMVYKLRDHLVGAKALMVIPIVPMAHGMANAAIGWPNWMALNSGYGYAATYPAAILSFAFACILVFVLAAIINDRGQSKERVA